MDFSEQNKRNAKFIRLVNEVLNKKNRGDLLSFEECDRILGTGESQHYRDRIRSWFRNRGHGLIAEVNIGYRVATASEQVFVIARGHQRRKLKQAKHALFHLRHAPEEGLDKGEQARRERLLEREAIALLKNEDDERHAKQVVGQMPEALPRLKADNGD